DYGKTARFQVKPDAPADAWDALPAWCEFPGGWQGVAGQGRTRNTMGMGLANVFPVPEISLHSDSALLEKARASFQFMDGDWRGFSPALIIAARLGLQDKVLPGLAQFSIRSQCGPQGWMTYMGSRKALDGRMKNGEDFDRLDQPRYQPYFEPLGGMTAATTTMLLDSLGGVIHVFPAYPRKGDARFCLRATNGLLVTGDMRNGEIAYVAISDAALQPMRVTNMDVSHDGVQPAGNAVPLPAGNAYETTVCAIANPWPGKVAQIVDATTGKIIVKPTTDAILRFIRPGIASLYLERPEFPAKEYPLLIVSGKPQQGPRVNGSVMLGMPKEGWPRYSGPTPGQIREQKLRAWQESLRPANLPNLAAAATGAVPWVLNPQNHPNRHNPAYLNDGLYGNDHSTISGGDAAMLGEFGIDLNRVETIGSVVWSRERNLKPGTPSSSDRTPKDYRIEVSLDKQQWTTVCTVTGNTTANGRREEFPPVKARYVRMLVTATSLPAPCLDELEVLPPDPDVRFKSLETLRAIPRGQAPDLTNPGGPSWATALRLDEFLQYAKRKLAPVQTQAWLLHDGQYLYVAVHCTEPLMTKLQSAVLPHDSENLFNGDDIELFLLPDPAGKEYYQIGINPDGSYIDARCLREPTTGNPLSFRMELAWNPQLQVNARKKADGWELTVRLPLKEAGLIPGKSFALQIGRNRKAADELSTWMFTDIGFHNPPTFGKMILE
ncbi:MAG TPA: discoidin domain-containing protein, partial [Armatimonadota bacterium]